jgi:putative ABC transport system permease protein
MSSPTIGLPAPQEISESTNVNRTDERSLLRIADTLRVGAAGPLARKMRTALSALGISIGIAALVGVLGLSESSKSALLDEISRLGTNVLTIEAGGGFGAGDGELPDSAPATIARIPTVTQASAIWDVDADVYRSEFIDDGQTGGIGVVGVDANLLDTLRGDVVEGVFIDQVESDYPVAVIGSVAAERLGIRGLEARPRIYVDDEYVEVVGILDGFSLADNLDRSVMISQDAAFAHFEVDSAPSVIHVRVEDGAIDATRDVLAATADPENPEEVTVSRPSEALTAQAAADDALTSLFLGLGAVALLVGGVGIANVMVIAVIERRGEIGLRRALGATQAHIRRQFLTEAVILSTLGGLAGVLLGVAVTYAYAATQGWRVIIPMEAAVGGFAAALGIGAIAGLYPAIRAARLAPTEALRA